MSNMLVGVKTSTYLHEGLKFVTPYEQYVSWRNNINFIFIRYQKKSPPPMNNLLIGVITSTLSSWPPEVRRGATSGLQRTCIHVQLNDFFSNTCFQLGKSMFDTYIYICDMCVCVFLIRQFVKQSCFQLSNAHVQYLF